VALRVGKAAERVPARRYGRVPHGAGSQARQHGPRRARVPTFILKKRPFFYKNVKKRTLQKKLKTKRLR
jgi:hypothetical protein